MKEKCCVNVNPTYSPSGDSKGEIQSTTVGGAKFANFSFSAGFENDAKKDCCCKCCEFRQYIMWVPANGTNTNRIPHFPSGSMPNVYYEDRDQNNKRYGHRSGNNSDPQDFDQYLDENGNRDQAEGCAYQGSDTPQIPATNRSWSKWVFYQFIVDVCNGEKKVAEGDTINIIFLIIVTMSLGFSNFSWAQSQYNDGPLLRILSANEDGLVEFEAINFTIDQSILLAPNNSWGDQCYFLIIEDKNKMQSIIRVPEQVYTRNGPSIWNLKKGKPQKMKIDFGKKVGRQISKSTNITIVYNVSKNILSDSSLNNVKYLQLQIPGKKFILRADKKT